LQRTAHRADAGTWLGVMTPHMDFPQQWNYPTKTNTHVRIYAHTQTHTNTHTDACTHLHVHTHLPTQPPPNTHTSSDPTRRYPSSQYTSDPSYHTSYHYCCQHATVCCSLPFTSQVQGSLSGMSHLTQWFCHVSGCLGAGSEASSGHHHMCMGNKNYNVTPDAAMACCST